MSDIRIEPQGEGHFLLVGELSFETVPGLYASSMAAMESAGEIIMDLHGVTRTDSAGLAMLIEWMRFAHRKTVNIRFKNLPAQMLAIAKVSRLDRILPVD
jgi:phospholipid transport system transporter-binding protein